MAKPRSPQYPQIGLKEAVGKARLVWEKDYKSELPRAVIAEHMGYSGLNGKSLALIAAVSRFGLFEGRGDQTKVSDLAVQILAHETGDEARASAVSKAAESPSLFREILEKFDRNSPSDQALKSYLLTRGFTLGGAEGVIRSFRDTESFVSEETKGVATRDADAAEDEQESREPEPKPSEEIGVIPVVSPTIGGVPTISMSDEGLLISAGVITTMGQFERLLRRLQAGKVLLDDEESDFDD